MPGSFYEWWARPRPGKVCWIRALGAMALLLRLGGAHAAPDLPTEPSLNESVVMVPSSRLVPMSLETSIFRPSGPGPFPVVVINHGKAPGPNRMQARYRPIPAVREFLQRGYAVVVPMRQGFSNSGGLAVGAGCNIAANGMAQAEDIRSVVSWIEQQSWADPRHMLMLGQSHGGLATLAYAREPHPGFKLFVNFAGGLRYSDGSCQWELALKSAYADYGASTRSASIWFYGANDSYFPPAVISPAYDAYVAAGGPAQMVAYGAFGTDAHAMFGSPQGVQIWWPVLQARLEALGMPTTIMYAEFATAGRMALPPPSGHAAIDDLGKLPALVPSGRKAYADFLVLGLPRAFAIGPGGHWARDNGGDDPARRALERCARTAGAPCSLYAVDRDVVWQVP